MKFSWQKYFAHLSLLRAFILTPIPVRMGEVAWAQTATVRMTQRIKQRFQQLENLLSSGWNNFFERGSETLTDVASCLSLFNDLASSRTSRGAQTYMDNILSAATTRSDTLLPGPAMTDIMDESVMTNVVVVGKQREKAATGFGSGKSKLGTLRSFLVRMKTTHGFNISAEGRITLWRRVTVL